MLTMKGAFYPPDCVARLYVPKKDGEMGVISVEDCVNQTKTALEVLFLLTVQAHYVLRPGRTLLNAKFHTDVTAEYSH